ncbi:MAG TPA: hypothetical protein VMR76_01240 [Candidatus Saccharimonadia bacterium]|nr:hypothetical protein [Candidatus Saccharimonadia bacterium]
MSPELPKYPKVDPRSELGEFGSLAEIISRISEYQDQLIWHPVNNPLPRNLEDTFKTEQERNNFHIDVADAVDRYESEHSDNQTLEKLYGEDTFLRWMQESLDSFLERIGKIPTEIGKQEEIKRRFKRVINLRKFTIIYMQANITIPEA